MCVKVSISNSMFDTRIKIAIFGNFNDTLLIGSPKFLPCTVKIATFQLENCGNDNFFIELTHFCESFNFELNVRYTNENRNIREF